MQERSQADSGLRTIDYGGERPLQVQDIDQEVVTSTLVAEDGSLVILGGMITERQQETERGIPFLKDIPFLGRFFMQKMNQDIREELMVLIRPTVIATPGESHQASDQVLSALKLERGSFELRGAQVPVIDGEE
jgi:type II secretory pathway component GspD/PulD (secretin)